MGHAFNQTVMDTLTRYHRMAGYNTVWIPGTDHAGIATQIVVERKLEKQGIAKVLRPSEHIKISKIEKDPNKLESLYQLGLRDAKRLLADKQGMEKQ